MKRGSWILLVAGLVMSAGCAGSEEGEPSEGVEQTLDAAKLEESLPHAPPSQTSEAEESTEVGIASGGTCYQCWQNTQYYCYYPTYNGCPFGWYSYFPPNNGCSWCYQDVCTTVPVSGGISASPTTVYVNTGSGSGCTSIQWNAACGTAQVYVSQNGAPESLFAQARTGTQSACFIQPGSYYDFCLYEGTSHSNKLSCVRVQGVDAGPAPDPCESCPGNTSCFCGDGVCRSYDTYCP